jgi:hypothetical protein
LIPFRLRQKSFAIETEGDSFIETPLGIVKNGKQKIMFSAYVKVINITGSKTQLNAEVLFKSELHKFTKNYIFSPSVSIGSANFIAQAYEHLKTLSEFAGATDC